MPRLSHLPLAASLLLLAAPALAQQAQPDFPDGPGKETFVAVCGGCHDINRARAGYTPAGWFMIEHMMQNIGAPVPPEDWPTLVTYLTKNFPERPRPPGAVVSGPVQVTMKLWDIPTIGSRPHDPLATRDGAIWWTGQLANKLGRVDPKNNTIREYTLKTPHTGPHGLREDKDGNIWFTGNHAGLVGRLNPVTGEVTEYKMPDAKVKDPHSLAVGADGIVWFTAQQSNVVGRVDSKSGEVKIIPMLTPRSRPYGIQIHANGMPVFCEFGSNKIATINPDTLELKEYALPDAASRPRRIWIVGDDVYYTDYSRGYLGRINLETGAHKEWASPSGPKSMPYGIAYAKGVIWYNESFAKPPMMVRFDPKTEQFQTFPIPGGGDIVRKMDVTPDGNPVMAHSLTNQVGIIMVK